MRSGPRGVEHVAAEAARVAERRALVVDAAVDAAAQVLDELAEDARVDGADALSRSMLMRAMRLLSASGLEAV